MVAHAPGVAAAAAARWLDALLHDCKGRLAALRRSRKRVARSLAELAQPGSGPQAGAAAAALLLRQLDGALEAEARCRPLPFTS